MRPKPTTIRDAVPLTARSPSVAPMLSCVICKEPVDPADLPTTAWREHDEKDRPIPGPEALVFLGQGTAHEACKKALADHPRLYSEETGAPGTFPALCGDCTHRRDLACSHPKLVANGGPGLCVSLTDPLRGAIVCGRGGRLRVVRRAMNCEGRGA